MPIYRVVWTEVNEQYKESYVIADHELEAEARVLNQDADHIILESSIGKHYPPERYETEEPIELLSNEEVSLRGWTKYVEETNNEFVS